MSQPMKDNQITVTLKLVGLADFKAAVRQARKQVKKFRKQLKCLGLKPTGK